MEMEKYHQLATQTHKALNSSPIDPQFLINLIKQTDNLERQFIREIYYKLFNIELMEDLKILRQLEGKPFEFLVIGLFRSPTEFDTYEIFEAVDGFGTNEDVLSEIMATRNSERINEIKNFYQVLFFSKLEEAIIEEKLPQNYSNFLNKILNRKVENDEKIINLINDENSFERKKLEKEFFTLKNLAKDAKNNTKEKRFEIYANILLMGNNSDQFINLLKNLYQKNFQKNLSEAISAEFENPLRDLLLYFLKGQGDRNFVEFYAERFFNSFKSEKINNKRIVRSMMSIYPVNMTEFRNYLEVNYKTTMENLISKYCKGLFKDLLIVVGQSDNISNFEIITA